MFLLALRLPALLQIPAKGQSQAKEACKKSCNTLHLYLVLLVFTLLSAQSSPSKGHTGAYGVRHRVRANWLSSAPRGHREPGLHPNRAQLFAIYRSNLVCICFLLVLLVAHPVFRSTSWIFILFLIRNYLEELWRPVLAGMHMWKSEDSLRGAVLSFHVCPRAQTCRLLLWVISVCLPWIALYKIFKYYKQAILTVSWSSFGKEVLESFFFFLRKSFPTLKKKKRNQAWKKGMKTNMNQGILLCPCLSSPWALMSALAFTSTQFQI